MRSGAGTGLNLIDFIAYRLFSRPNRGEFTLDPLLHLKAIHFLLDFALNIADTPANPCIPCARHTGSMWQFFGAKHDQRNCAKQQDFGKA